MFTVSHGEVQTMVWRELESGERKGEIEVVTSICESVDDRDLRRSTLYLGIEKPRPFSVNEWKRSFVVLHYVGGEESGIHHLYLCRQEYPTVWRCGKESMCSGQEAIYLTKDLMRKLRIHRIYIEDEAMIGVAGDQYLLSDREDILYGTFSWYLRFFKLEDEGLRQWVEERKRKISRIPPILLGDVESRTFFEATEKIFKHDLKNASKEILRVKEILECLGVPFTQRQFVATP